VSTPILATKIYVPPQRDEFVSRPHLVERLDAGLFRKLTLISAPAGFGKTSLLSEWIASSRSIGSSQSIKFAWFSLDEHDNDLIRFWTYLIAALQTIEPDFGKAELAAFQSSQSPPVEVILSGLINEIDGTIQRIALIIDDYHLIDTQSIHQSVGYLLDNLPPQMHLVIATRSDPPIPLSRMRGQRFLTELRPDDLRFDMEEADRFLNGVMDLELSLDDVAALCQRTEGWIVGLQLAGLSMQSCSDRHTFVMGFTGDDRYIADFLVEEVLQRHPQVVQDFLVQTSILDRFNAELCEAVLRMGSTESKCEIDLPGQHSHRDASASVDSPASFSSSFMHSPPANYLLSQEIIEYMDRSNLFLIPLDDHREWYRYHHLFAELLRARLRHRKSEELKLLHHRASCWYEEHDLPHEAIRHSLAANEIPRTAALIEKNAVKLMGHGEVGTLTGWLEMLPSDLVQSRPWLSVYKAWIMLSAGRLDAIEPILQQAESSLQNSMSSEAYCIQPEETIPKSQSADFREVELWEIMRVKGHIATIRACQGALSGDQPRTLRFSRRALKYLYEPDEMARGLAYLVLGLALRWDGDLVGAVHAFSSAETVGRKSGDSYVSIFATCYKGYVLTLMGRLHKALKTIRGALEFAEKSSRKSGWKPPISGLAHTFLCAVFIEWNDLEAALASAKNGLELSQKMGHAYAIMDGYFFVISALIELGEYSSAKREIQNARNFAGLVSPWASIDVLLLECKLHLAQGDIDEAERLVSKLELKPDNQYESMRFNQYLLLARILVAKRKTHEALQVLARLLDLVESSGADGRVIEVLALQAIAFSQNGDQNPAIDTLARAISMAEPEGYVRSFLNEGTPMEDLLRTAADRGITVEYVGKLLADFEVERSESRQKEKMSPSLQMIEPLSEREIEVLCLLDTNMTSVEIAAQLHLAPSTIQTHCKNIYRKRHLNTASAREIRGDWGELFAPVRAKDCPILIKSRNSLFFAILDIQATVAITL